MRGRHQTRSCIVAKYQSSAPGGSLFRHHRGDNATRLFRVVGAVSERGGTVAEASRSRPISAINQI